MVAAFTAADIPGELMVGIIYKDWPVMIPVGGRTSYAGDVLAIVVAATPAAARAAAELVDISYGVLRSGDRSGSGVGSTARRSRCGAPTATFCRVRPISAAMSTAALQASAHVVHETFQTQRIEHAFLEPESTLAVPDVERRHAARLFRRPGRVGRPQRHRPHARRRERPDHGRARLQRRCVRRQGRHVQPGPRRARRVDARRPGQVHARRVKRAFACMPNGIRSDLRIRPAAMRRAGSLRLRVRAVGDSGAYASVGMKVLERAAGHASGPYEVVEHRCRGGRGPHQQSGVRRVPRVRRQPGAVRDGRHHRPARRGSRHRRLGDAQAQRDPPRRACGVRARSWTTAASAPSCASTRSSRHYDAARDAGRAVGLGLGLKNSGLGNGFKEITRGLVRFAADGTVDGDARLDRDGPRACTPSRCRSPPKSWASRPHASACSVDTTRELGLGQTTGSRGTLMGAGAVKAACDAALAGGCEIDVDYIGEYRVDWTNKLGEVEDPIIHSTFSYAAQLVVMDPSTQAIERVVAVHDVGRAVNPLLCEGQIEGSVHMGLGYALTEDFPAIRRRDSRRSTRCAASVSSDRKTCRR